MRIILAASLVASCLAGCAKPPVVIDTATPATVETVTGYSSEDNMVILLNGQKPVSSLPPPNDADRKYIAKVPEPVRTAVIAFLAQPKIEFTIVAARPYGRILLLDVEPKGWDDANTHIVYDLKREVVVGRFVWHIQG